MADPPRPDGLTALMVAAGRGGSAAVEALLAAGADVHAVDPRTGATALAKAAMAGDDDVIGLLLDHGAFIDQQNPLIGHTALIDAVLHKREDAVRVLLDRGARTTLRSHAGHNALDHARTGRLDAIARLIEARDADDARKIAAHALMAAVRRDYAAGVASALAAGASVDETLAAVGDDDDGFTPLGIAAREGRTTIVRLLLAAGADAGAQNGMMQGNAAHEAAYFGHAEVIRLLAAAGAFAAPAATLDAQGVHNGFTPLHDAVWNGHVEAARALVEAGARLDLVTHSGATAHDLALAYGYHDLAALLAGS